MIGKWWKFLLHFGGLWMGCKGWRKGAWKCLQTAILLWLLRRQMEFYNVPQGCHYNDGNSALVKCPTHSWFQICCRCAAGGAHALLEVRSKSCFHAGITKLARTVDADGWLEPFCSRQWLKINSGLFSVFVAEESTVCVSNETGLSEMWMGPFI